MPRRDRQVCVATNVFQPPHLIGDKCLERCDIQNVEAGLLNGFIEYLGQQREECGFGLPSGSAGGDDQVAIAVHEHVRCTGLDVAQFLPAFLTNPFLDRSSQLVERRAHSRKLASSSLSGTAPTLSSTSLMSSPESSATSSSSMRSDHSTPGFCSSTARRFTKAVTVLRGVRK